MKCHLCSEERPRRSVCPECGIAIRPNSLVAVSVLQLAVAVISLTQQNPIFGIVSGIIGFFILRVSRLAIAASAALTVIASLFLVVAMFFFDGGTGLVVEGAVEGIDPNVMKIRMGGQLLLHIAIGVLLLRPESRLAFRLAGMDETGRAEIVAREGGAE